MNLDSLSERELVNYLAMYSTDPAVHRLIGMIEYTREEYTDLVDNLVEAGMDRDYLVFHGLTSPGSYIKELEFQVDELERDVERLNEDLEELKTKTVLEFLSEVKQELKIMRQRQSTDTNTIRSLEHELKATQEKLQVWNVMNKV